jgi:acyl-coenzyme A synthetase/AMP-(fatty) acid ligase
VADAGVAGLADQTWGEAIAAYVVTSSPVAEHELQAWCRERLDAYKVPKRVTYVRELPRNANGKLMRNHLHHLESAAR